MGLLKSENKIVAALVALCVLGLYGVRCTRAQGPEPANFLYTNASDLAGIGDLMNRPDIEGVQIVYNWRDLEPTMDTYDFTQIESDLLKLESLHKKLFIQVQDRFFLPKDKNVPTYLMENPIYGGGIVRQSDNPGQGKPVGSGWVAQQWNPNVQRQYQRLLQALGQRFDGRVYGVNLPETAIDIDRKNDHTGFSCDKYFDAEMENMKFAKGVFKKSYVVQYVNFWPCEWNNDHKYMSRTFDLAARDKIGLGGPDIVPYRDGQMKNSYPFFNAYRSRLVLVAMAVQEPTLTYTNPATGKKFTKDEFQRFGRDYLGTSMIFWSTSSPWLHRH